MREEFAYAEKANEERAGIGRDACLAPEGETWKMMLRQEAALDHSIDRKVRILLRLRKDATDRPVAPAGQGDGAGVENTEEIVESDIWAQAPQGGGAVKELKMNEQSGNVTENKHSYAQDPGMLLKTDGVTVW